MAALLAGQGIAEVAREYNLPVSTVHDWKGKAEEYANRPDVGALLLGYLAELLPTLTAQAVAFRDPEWLREQGASEAAVLHGVLVDKAVRLLEAMSPQEPEPPPLPNRMVRHQVNGKG